jgi:hypothetical protein
VLLRWNRRCFASQLNCRLNSFNSYANYRFSLFQYLYQMAYVLHCVAVKKHSIPWLFFFNKRDIGFGSKSGESCICKVLLINFVIKPFYYESHRLPRNCYVINLLVEVLANFPSGSKEIERTKIHINVSCSCVIQQIRKKREQSNKTTFLLMDKHFYH